METWNENRRNILLGKKDTGKAGSHDHIFTGIYLPTFRRPGAADYRIADTGCHYGERMDGRPECHRNGGCHRGDEVGGCSADGGGV